MAKGGMIFPMAFEVKGNTECHLYYVGFPKEWKERLIEIQKKYKPKWDPETALPTGNLKRSLLAWMDDYVEIENLKTSSNDEKWMYACEKINIDHLLQHIKVWIRLEYKNGSAEVERLVEQLLQDMTKEQLQELEGEENIKLFEEDGTVSSHYAFRSFPLLLIKKLIGKTITIDGHEMELHYAGDKELITDIQREGNFLFSYGISFSLETIPPDRKNLLLCKCVIHRWIPKAVKEKPYFHGNSIHTHIWVGNHRIYKIPLHHYYKREKEYIWDPAAKQYYNIYNRKILPTEMEVLGAIDEYSKQEQPIAMPYKNGMDKCGFAKSMIGEGVSFLERRQIFDQVHERIKDYVVPIEDIKRISRAKNAARSLKLDKINLNQGMKEEQREGFANRMYECLGRKALRLEVYYMNSAKKHAERIKEELENTFHSNDKISFSIELCELGVLGECLEIEEKKGNVTKRIHEVKRAIPMANELTGCFILLPGKEDFEKLGKESDPKEALRNGFAATNRLTQFIVPWEEKKENKKKQEKEIKSIIASAIEDMCRQLGYLRSVDDTVMKKKENLMHVPVIGVHVIRIARKRGNDILIPVYIKVDYITGKVSVESELFENEKNVSYHEALLKIAKISREKKWEKQYNSIKERIKLWKVEYEKDPVLIVLEADASTRKLWYGITDIRMKSYEYKEEYRPKEIAVGKKECEGMLDLNGTGIRIVRFRTKAEVPGYYTELNAENQASSGSGLFRYQKIYWAIGARSADRPYQNAGTCTKFSKPDQIVRTMDMSELYPIQLQEGDDSNSWVTHAEALRRGTLQYDHTLNVPIAVHLAKKMEEYCFLPQEHQL